MRFPSRNQWLKILRVLTKKEKIAFLSFLGLFLISATSLAVIFYFKNTEVRPRVAGKLTEGIVGSPRFINPIYAQSSDVDRDLTELIFSGLMQYDGQGQIVPDLAKEVQINDEGTAYEIKIKENVVWHDGKPLNADDVIFTIKIIQDPEYKSPLRGNYLGVEAEKINDLTVRLKLKSAYSGFLERLTLKILPKHIFEEISPQNFLLTNYNLRPVGSGPYQFKNLRQDSSGFIASLDLARFKNYYSADKPQKPYLSEISFKFFKTEDDLVKAAKRGSVKSFALSSPENSKEFVKKSGLQKLSISLPRYFALFFNQDKNRFLADKPIRKALNYLTDKKAIVDAVLAGQGEIVESPILPEIYGYATSSKIYEFSQEKAEALLKQAGLEKKDGKWIKATKQATVDFKSDLKVGSSGKEVTSLQNCLNMDATGYFGDKTKQAVQEFQKKYAIDRTGTVGKLTKAKLQEVCSKPAEETALNFSLAVPKDSTLEKVASLLKDQWAAAGVGLNIQSYSASQLEQEIIKPRDYQILLFGEVLELIPDPFPFWHSSQKKDPGLNLAKYENKDADKLLETARASLDDATRTKKYESFQNIVIEDAPAVFLYNPNYVYFLPSGIKGVDLRIIADPSKRFTNIEEWYTKTRRVFK